MAATDTKAEAPAATAMLSGFSVNVSHQELDRIVDEIEQLYFNQSEQWLALEPVRNFVMATLGYEDAAELEDALKGPFVEFLQKLPCVVMRTNDEGALEYRVKLEGEDAKPASTLRLRVTQPSDLWRVCMRSPSSSVRIPELEFEVGSENKRVIDSIYNHVSRMIFNLSRYASLPGQLTDEDREKIQSTVSDLEGLLDLKHAWTWEVVDPTGMSEVQPMDDVEVVPLEMK
ncbi:unnamed protein product [Pedinophyceae sp. YPF-701]|nr:unnamed protein product [Pedinophyceae sp. YPF-701]